MHVSAALLISHKNMMFAEVLSLIMFEQSKYEKEQF